MNRRSCTSLCFPLFIAGLFLFASTFAVPALAQFWKKTSSKPKSSEEITEIDRDAFMKAYEQNAPSLGEAPPSSSAPISRAVGSQAKQANSTASGRSGGYASTAADEVDSIAGDSCATAGHTNGTFDHANTTTSTAARAVDVANAPNSNASASSSTQTAPNATSANSSNTQAENQGNSKSKFRFPWTKNTTDAQDKTASVDDPFGPASLPETPDYQDLSQLPDVQTTESTQATSSTGSPLDGISTNGGAAGSLGTSPMSSFAPVSASASGSTSASASAVSSEPSNYSNYSDAFRSAVQSPGSSVAEGIDTAISAPIGTEVAEGNRTVPAGTTATATGAIGNAVGATVATGNPTAIAGTTASTTGNTTAGRPTARRLAPPKSGVVPPAEMTLTPAHAAQVSTGATQIPADTAQVPAGTIQTSAETTLSQADGTTAPTSPASGTDVTVPADSSAASATAQATTPSVTQDLATDAMLTKIPAAQVDTTALSGEGLQFYANGQTLARVGTQVVLAGDITDTVDSLLEANADKIPPEAYDMQREMLIRSYLEQAIETKLVYCDVVRNLPADGLKSNIELIDNLFESDELPSRMKKAGITLRDEYEALLETQGTTIQRQKFLFRELVLCHQWTQQSISVSKEVSPPELLDYYKEHIAEFETPAEATWEELVVKKANFNSRDEAYREMVRIGSMVAVAKRPFAEVAKEFSQGVTAKSGGERPWVKPGELASKPLETAVFSQPVGQLSAEIIEDETCFYVICVKERHEKITEPFVDAQVKIRKCILDERNEAARKAYIARLRKEIPVFTVFDGIPSPEERMKAQQKQPQGAFGNAF